MKIYHSRKNLKKMESEELTRLHRLYIRVISIFLSVGGILSLMGIWDYLSPPFIYSAPVIVLVIWPWIMQSAYMARKKKEKAAS